MICIVNKIFDKKKIVKSTETAIHEYKKMWLFSAYPKGKFHNDFLQLYGKFILFDQKHPFYNNKIN